MPVAFWSSLVIATMHSRLNRVMCLLTTRAQFLLPEHLNLCIEAGDLCMEYDRERTDKDVTMIRFIDGGDALSFKRKKPGA